MVPGTYLHCSRYVLVGEQQINERRPEYLNNQRSTAHIQSGSYLPSPRWSPPRAALRGHPLSTVVLTTLLSYSLHCQHCCPHQASFPARDRLQQRIQQQRRHRRHLESSLALPQARQGRLPFPGRPPPCTTDASTIASLIQACVYVLQVYLWWEVIGRRDAAGPPAAPQNQKLQPQWSLKVRCDAGARRQ